MQGFFHVSSVFELIMLVCFGLAWPVTLYKSYMSRTTAGKSVGFTVLIAVGYMNGLIHKLLYSQDMVMCLYALNLVMVILDILLYIRNRRLDARKAQAGSAKT